MHSGMPVITIKLSDPADLAARGVICPWCMLLTVRECARCREVAKAVKLKKAKTVVVAPNIEQIESEGGLDELLSSILAQVSLPHLCWHAGT